VFSALGLRHALGLGHPLVVVKGQHNALRPGVEVVLDGPLELASDVVVPGARRAAVGAHELDLAV